MVVTGLPPLGTFCALMNVKITHNLSSCLNKNY